MKYKVIKLMSVFLIAKTTDREASGIGGAVPGHAGAAAAEVSAVGVATIELGSTPKADVAAEFAVVAVVVASGKGTEACGVVV